MRGSNESPVFLVVGACGGIGSELCRLLESSGAQIAAAGRDLDRVKDGGIEARAGLFELDATDFDSVERALGAVQEGAGRLDGVACCVGSLLLKPAHLTTFDEWSTTIATNLGAAFAVVRAAGRRMKEGGSVVAVSSAAARIGLASHEAIAAAKAGIIGLVQSAAATYAKRGLRFNAVAPGLVRTGMTERITGNAAALDTSRSMHALGRIGEPVDVASMIAWLLDPDRSWITGQVFGVDGGLATVRPSAAR